MISKIYNIRGVGRFKNFKPDEPIKLADFNLIYAENGMGKSTLAYIFRSLDDDASTLLSDRLSVGADDQLVVLELQDSNRLAYSSAAKKWSQSIQNIFVFDQKFINDNVYVGNDVETHNLRNVVQLVIGEKSLRLQAEEDRLKESIDTRRTTKDQLEKQIVAEILQPSDRSVARLSLDWYLRLQDDPHVAAKRKAQEHKVQQLVRGDEIAKRDLLSIVNVPQLPLSELQVLLQSSLDDIQHRAEDQLQDHMAQYSDRNFEGWLRRGTEYLESRTDVCPYCGQSLDAASLIKHYQEFFSDTYNAHLSRIKNFDSDRMNYTRELQAINSALTANDERLEFWGEIEAIGALPAISFKLIESALNGVVDEIHALLAAKTSSPLERIEFSPIYQERLRNWQLVAQAIREYNAAAKQINGKISGIKTSVTVGDINAERRLVIELANIERRYEPEVIELVKELRSETALLTQANDSKSRIQQEKDNAVLESFAKYMNDVNNILGDFGASFQIVDFKHGRDSRKPRAQYFLELLGSKIPVGSNKKDQEGRSFGSVLSEGDKRTLALAFFLARLKRDTEIHNKLIIFDDPVISLDDNRGTRTCEIIADLSMRAQQCIVLSHRLAFLKLLWDEYVKHEDDHGPEKLHEICHQVGNIEFSEIRSNWNIYEAVESVFTRDVRDVVDYLDGCSDLSVNEVARKLRPILETYYASLYPHEFPNEEDRFGAFINRVESCNQSSALIQVKNHKLTELSQLNRYASKFHHKNPPTPTTNELMSYCAKVLNHIGRL